MVKKKKKKDQIWQCILVIPQCRRLKQEDFKYEPAWLYNKALPQKNKKE